MRHTVFLLSLLFCLGCPGLAQAAEIAIADQQAATFSDPLFAPLNINKARINVAWDALDHAWQRDEIDLWMAAAETSHISPLVIFSQSRVKGQTRLLPSPGQFATIVSDFRRRYPFVREFATWNEANHHGQPTYNRPRLVARYYHALRRQCSDCRILAASLLDSKTMLPYARDLKRAIIDLGDPSPSYWGLQNYNDVNRLSDKQTRRLLRQVGGSIWLTETGGIIKNRHLAHFNNSPTQAGRITKYILRLTQRQPRIRRVYFYQWRAPQGLINWDSGLLDRHGQPRPSYHILRRWTTSYQAPKPSP